MGQTSASFLTAQDFLQLPPGEDDLTTELIAGVAIPKVSPKFYHAKLTRAFLTILGPWSLDRGELCPEWAVVLQRQGEDWVPMPDLLFVSRDRLPEQWDEDEACPVPPELAIEIISRGQTFGQLTAKAQNYLDAGILRVWIVDAQARTITAFFPQATPRTYQIGEVVEDELFPDLKLGIETLFQQARI